MTLGKRIGWGLGAILALMSFIGGLAVTNMDRSSRSARTLAEACVPQATLGGELGEAASEAQLAATAFAYTCGIQISLEVDEHLKTIASKTSEVDSLINRVAQALREQAQGVQQLNTTVAEMEKATQSNAANAEQTASAAEELNAQTLMFTEAVQELSELAGSGCNTGQQVPLQKSLSPESAPARTPTAPRSPAYRPLTVANNRTSNQQQTVSRM